MDRAVISGRWRRGSGGDQADGRLEGAEAGAGADAGSWKMLPPGVGFLPVREESEVLENHADVRLGTPAAM